MAKQTVVGSLSNDPSLVAARVDANWFKKLVDYRVGKRGGTYAESAKLLQDELGAVDVANLSAVLVNQGFAAPRGVAKTVTSIIDWQNAQVRGSAPAVENVIDGPSSSDRHRAGEAQQPESMAGRDADAFDVPHHNDPQPQGLTARPKTPKEALQDIYERNTPHPEGVSLDELSGAGLKEDVVSHARADAKDFAALDGVGRTEAAHILIGNLHNRDYSAEFVRNNAEAAQFIVREATPESEFGREGGVEAQKNSAKARLLSAIGQQEKTLAATLGDTAMSATGAIGKLTEAKALLQRLRNTVEEDAAVEAVQAAFAELKTAGLPVQALATDLKMFGINEEEPEPQREEGEAQELPDTFRMAVPTSGLKQGVKKPSGQAVASPETGDAEIGDTVRQAGTPVGKAPTPADEQNRVNREPQTLLNGTFVRKDKGEYVRAREDDKVCLVDEGTSVRFVDKQMDTFQAAIELVAAKGWGAIEVTGSDKFRAEAWLHSSLAGLEVIGYEPAAKDLARLDSEKARLNGRQDANLVEASLQSAHALANLNYAEVATADTEKGRYTGKITHETPFHVVQSHGRNSAVIHAKKFLSDDELSRALEDNLELKVEYCRNGVVHSKAKSKTQSKNATLER